MFLTGASAPRGGALIDTKTMACEGAAGSFICRGAFEALPKGTYKFRILVSGNGAANVTLTRALVDAHPRGCAHPRGVADQVMANV